MSAFTSAVARAGSPAPKTNTSDSSGITIGGTISMFGSVVVDLTMDSNTLSAVHVMAHFTVTAPSTSTT